MEQSKNDTNEWPSDAVVALIEWLPNLTKTTMPIALRDFVTGDSNVKQPLDVTSSKELATLDENILTQLVQWSDLVIFDYLTGNYDRVASMQVTLKYFLPSFIFCQNSTNDVIFRCPLNYLPYKSK